MIGLINLMEETVLNKIDQLLPNTDYCKCDSCRMDIATYALNRLPAQYVQSIKGKVLYRFASSQVQNDIEVTVAVSKAIEVVGKAPHKNVNFVETKDILLKVLWDILENVVKMDMCIISEFFMMQNIFV